MRRRSVSIALACLTGLLSFGCGGDALPPPEGFTLEVRLVAINPSVLTNLSINIEPQGTDERFMALIEPLSFDPDGRFNENGPITYSVAADGALEIDVVGSFVNDNALDNGNGSFTFSLQMWSAIVECNEQGRDCQYTQESRARAPAPRVTVIANRGAQAIGDNRLPLPGWPLPIGGTASVEVTCRADAVGMCQP